MSELPILAASEPQNRTPMFRKSKDESSGGQRLKDEALLASLGYKQELVRDFSGVELFGLAFSLIGVVPAYSSVLVYSIPNGGPAAMVWGWAASSIFLIFIALAMAELGSSMPTSGGLYYWTHKFSSQRCRNVLSWIVGYTNSIAYIAGTAGVDWGCAVMIMAAVSIGSDMTFVPTTAQTYGIYVALLVCHAILASSATHVLARLTTSYIILNVILCLVMIIGLPAATPSELKNSARFAFGNFENFYPWPNGFSFILSFLAPTWVISGFDSSVHISEEAKNAKVVVPWAIISATTVGAILGWALNVVLVFNMGTDLTDILGSPIGQPMATILLNSFGKRSTLAIWSFIIVSQFMIGISILTVSSRQNFAFARDGALPFSKFLYRINTRTKTPVNCVWAAAFIAALLGLLAFAGPAAIGAVFTLGVVAQYVSDSIPIAARFLGGNKFTAGPFHLGKFSLPVAIAAVAWMTFMSTVLLFPTTPQVNAQDMNYTIIIFGGVVLFSLVYYYIPRYGGVYWFNGPVATIDDQNANNILAEDEQTQFQGHSPSVGSDEKR